MIEKSAKDAELNENINKSIINRDLNETIATDVFETPLPPVNRWVVHIFEFMIKRKLI